MYRLDGVPVRAEQVVESELPSEADILAELLLRVGGPARRA
jgi:formylmethanofuran dehydrogenase subunit B